MATTRTREEIDRQDRRINREHQIAVLKGLILKLEEEEKADGEAYAKLRQV